jgi:predicted CopG family antitoxin
VLTLTTIKISEETHVELNKIKGSLLAKDGKERSFDDVIRELIACWKQHSR